MPIGDLFERGEQAYVEAERPGPQDLWLFIHLPKTAGSSLQSQFARALKPAFNIHVDYSRPRTSYAADFGHAVDLFLEAAQHRRFRFASGHIDLGMARRIREALAPVRIFTFLRHPVARMVSEYRYQRTPAHPPHEEFRRRFPTIEDFIREPRLQNGMCQRLVLRGESVAEAAARMEQEFSFVGVLEHYGFCLELLNRVSGAGLKPEVVVRRTEEADNQVLLTPELQAEIAALNSRDLELWSHFHQRLAAARPGGGSELDEAGREA
jgi:hypothetical protein